jgi:hypothetical protein
MPQNARAVLFLTFFLLALPVRAQENDFKKANPDIDKYSFANDFITSLSYYNRVALRFKAQEKAKAAEASRAAAKPEAPADQKAVIDKILKTIKDCTLDNTELRIARNYLTKFQSSGNVFIQSVAQKAIDAYDRFLGLNFRERDLWMGFYRFKTTNLPANYSESDFVSSQVGLALEKKEMAKGLLEASVLFQKVLLSAQRCESDDCKELALTKEERYKLIKKLDSFASGTMDWGMKAGHTTLEGCVASLREILEDPLFLSKSP